MSLSSQFYAFSLVKFHSTLVLLNYTFLLDQLLTSLQISILIIFSHNRSPLESELSLCISKSHLGLLLRYFRLEGSAGFQECDVCTCRVTKLYATQNMDSNQKNLKLIATASIDSCHICSNSIIISQLLNQKLADSKPIFCKYNFQLMGVHSICDVIHH